MPTNNGNNSNSSKSIPKSSPKPPRTSVRDGSGNKDTTRLDELFKRH
ncbi:hypothetical protein [Clostridium beijerinckii]|nr:hypothetical protein [Clostridium beijerinckii]NRT76284.1 hypothetical protein [Clostridium beijerinckii]OOM38508.1 hypothetical protein CBEIJ_48440 [Clostridium beijerinckii]